MADVVSEHDYILLLGKMAVHSEHVEALGRWLLRRRNGARMTEIALPSQILSTRKPQVSFGLRTGRSPSSRAQCRSNGFKSSIL